MAGSDSPSGQLMGQEVPAAGWRGTLGSLSIGNFRWYWVGMLGAFFAMQMDLLARGWLVYDMSGSALALGVVSAGWGIPVILLSLFGGVVTDRRQKRNILIVTQALAGVVTVAVTILIATGLIQIWHLIVASLLNGTIFAFHLPGRQAIIPELVGRGHLMNAIALNSSGMNLSRIVAPALAGVLVGVAGVAGAYYVIIAFHLLSTLSLCMIPASGQSIAVRGNSVLRDLVDGLHYIRQRSTIMLLLAMAFVPLLFGMPYLMLLPVFAVDVLHVGPTGLGALTAASGAGALLGSLGIASLGDFRRKGLSVLALLLAFGVFVILFASSTSLYLSLLLLVFVGFGSAGYLAINSTMLQTRIAPEMMGRVMSVYSMTFGLMPLGTLVVGALAERWGTSLSLMAGGAVLVAFTISIAILSPNIRKLE